MKTHISLLILVAVCLGMPARGLAAEATPDGVVAEFHAGLLAVMKDGKALGPKGRYDRLDPMVLKAFDLGRMIRVAAGSYWRKSDDAARKGMLGAFRRLSVATYAAQFTSHGGEAFETLGQRDGPQKTRLVSTRIIKGGETKAKLTYVLKLSKQGWQIVDVLLDNAISQLAVRLSEYQRVLKRQGVPGLVDTLNKKSEDLLRP